MDLSYCKLRRLFTQTGFRVVRAFGIGSWIFRRRWQCHEFLCSRTAQQLEGISKLANLSAVSPDCVVVARKVAANL
jgi:hypothetical protein